MYFRVSTIKLLLCPAVMAAAALFAGNSEIALSRTITEKRYKPELVLQVGHVGPILSIAYSPDGKLIASGGADATVKLWDVETGRELRTLIGHILSVNAVAFSPDGRMVASAGGDFVAKLWDVRSGASIKTLQYHANVVTCLAFSADGKTIVTGSDDQTIKLWDIATGKELFTSGEVKNYDPEIVQYEPGTIPVPRPAKSGVSSVAINPENTLIAVGRNDNSIEIVSARDGKRVKLISGLVSPALQVSFTADGIGLIGTESEEIKVWNIGSDPVTSRPLAASKEASKTIKAVAFSPDRSLLASVDKNDVRSWDVTSGKELPAVKVADDLDVRAFAVSPDKSSVAVGASVKNERHVIQIRDLTGRREARTFGGSSNQVFTMAVSPDGRKIATAPEVGKTVKIWDLTGRSSVKTLVTESSGIPSLRFSPDSSKLAVDSVKNLELWDVESNRRIRSLLEDVPSLERSSKFMPDGKQIVGLNFGLSVDIYDAATGAVIKRFEQPNNTSTIGPPESFAVDRRGKNLAVGFQNGKVLVLDVKSGPAQESGCSAENGYLASSLEFSPDGRLLASSAQPGKTAICDIETHKLLWTIDSMDLKADSLHSYFSSFAFSPDSHLLAGIANDSLIKVWDALSGKPIYEFPGHNRNRYLRNSVTFSPDGKILYSTDGGNRIRLWNMTSGVELASFVSSGDKDWAVVTPDGFFDASEGGQELLHFIVASDTGYETISLDQLKWYYVPGLLKNIISGDYKAKEGEFTVTLSPRVFLDPSTPDGASINAELTDRGGGIGRIEVRINGSELYADARTAENGSTRLIGRKLKFVIPRERLRIGPNTVEVFAWNGEGNVRGRPQAMGLDVAADGLITRGVEYQRNESKKKPSEINFYAIISGISDYAGDGLDLRYAAKDAEDITKALSIATRRYFCAAEMAEKKQCTRVHIRLLSTESNIETQFTKLEGIPDFKRLDPVKSSYTDVFAETAKAAGPDDVVLIYFSGHATSVISDDAIKDSGLADTYIYATREATTLDRAIMTNRSERERVSVSSLELAKWLSIINADKKVLILDTCAAGAVQGDLVAQARAVDALQVRSIDNLQGRTGFYVMMGSAADAVSYEANEFRQGLLTYSLLEGMTLGTTLSAGGFLDVETWFHFSANRVEDLAKGIGGIQKPRFIKTSSAGSFDIGRIEGADLLQIPVGRRVPLILRPELREEGKRTDRERLTEKLELKLAEQSLVVSRGQGAAINYVNAANAANGLSPRGSYTITGDVVTVELSLVMDEDEVVRIRVSGTREEIIDKLTQAIVEAASKKK